MGYVRHFRRINGCLDCLVGIKLRALVTKPFIPPSIVSAFSTDYAADRTAAGGLKVQVFTVDTLTNIANITYAATVSASFYWAAADLATGMGYFAQNVANQNSLVRSLMATSCSYQSTVPSR